MDGQDDGPAHRPSSCLSSGEHSKEDKSEGGDGYGEEPRCPVLGNLAARTSHLEVHSLATDDDAPLRGDDEDGGRARHGLTAKAGIIIGIHNIFIVVPQYIMTDSASVIFFFLNPTQDAKTDEAHVEVLIAGGGPNSFTGAH
ncbi:hypothetical protein BD413DRAFT_535194 [Trametes elegans]|nr:hypothetical protein BD413DRAFT_535194 [Trametes elegans]